ncbi:unnamed protein product [Gongylonema pulchrum]|uniref:Uncharacterized protein n=1 Tax=Gongylonema pulchrum TaxID=637853 RepID=A0A183D032_9BILA|nr:unnamed protein product [Gongylonema pulchrum]
MHTPCAEIDKRSRPNNSTPSNDCAATRQQIHLAALMVRRPSVPVYSATAAQDSCVPLVTCVVRRRALSVTILST